jgi:integrase
MPLRVKNGRWEYRFKIEGQPRVSKLTDLEGTEQNKKRAERLERDHRDRILKGLEQARKPKPILFSTAVEEFLQHCRVEHKDHTNTSDRVATSTSSLLAMFRNRTVPSIGSPDVERYKVWRLAGDSEMKGVKTVTLRHDLDNFSKFFEWAITMRYATFNPVRGVSKPSIEDAVRMYILSEAEEFLYFEEALARSIDLHDVATIIDNQGMRPEEVVEIEKKDVDLVARTIRIPKGKTKAARRTLRLTTTSFEVLKRRFHETELSETKLKEVCERLAKRLKTNPMKIAERERQKSRFVFPARRFGKRGKAHISLSGLENCHDDVLKACNEKGQAIPFVLYDLRHTFATRAAQEGMPLPTLASVLGHSSLRQVQKYVHPTQDHQQSEMDRVDRIRQENKQRYRESRRSQAHDRPTANGNFGDFPGSGGNGQESCNDDEAA